ncbi:MAG TPA: hypothetical protein VKB93_12425 [Thermoanaerobaculia bacterium]|nr:hypothetical protein [Thermoanaerobaculia bacterium]
MNPTPRAVTSLERRVTAVLCVRQLIAWATVAAIVWGVIILVARLAFAASPPLFILLAMLPVVIGGAVLHALRMRPSRNALIALLDAESNCGGLLMASDAVPLGEWNVDVARVPRVRWASRRHLIVAALCLGFAAAAMFVPIRAEASKQTLDVRRDADQLQKRIDLLREEEVIPEARAEAMTKTVEALRREAEADDPAKAWEALDSIAESTSQAAKEAGEEAVRKGEQLTRAEAMAMGLASDALDPSQLAQAMREMANEMQSQELQSKLPADLRDAISKGQLTKEQLRQLEQALRNQKGKLRSSMAKLQKAGLIDAKTLKACENATNGGNGSGGGLAQFLRENAGKQGFSNAIGEWVQGTPGRDRGRGDAPMFFGEEAREDGAFKEQTLPPATAASLSNSQTVAVSAATPNANDSERSRGGALTNAQAGSGSAITTAVLPRHRGTVERFFERKP